MVKIIKIPTFIDERGSLSVIEKNENFPFTVKRAFYLFDIKKGKNRGGHAHIECQQFLIAINGSFKVRIKSENKENIFLLNNKTEGLYIPKLTWAEEFDFSSDDTVCLVLASHKYNLNDYIGDYNMFLKSFQ